MGSTCAYHLIFSALFLKCTYWKTEEICAMESISHWEVPVTMSPDYDSWSEPSLRITLQGIKGTSDLMTGPKWPGIRNVSKNTWLCCFI